MPNAEQLARRVELLEHRLRELEDKEEIRALKARHFAYVDGEWHCRLMKCVVARQAPRASWGSPSATGR